MNEKAYAVLERAKPVTSFIERYASSVYALIVYAILAMLGWMFMLTEFVLPIFGVLALCIALSCKNFNGIIGIFSTFLFSIFTSTEYKGMEFGTGCYIGFTLLFASFVLYMIKNKVKPKFTANFYGICALSIIMSAGGIFNYRAGFLPALMMCGISLAFPCIYLLLTSTLTREGKHFYMQSMLTMGLIICLQTFVLILRSSDVNSMLVNKEMWFGWGISNTAAIMLVASIGATIYLSASCNKMPAFFMVLAFLQSGFLILMFARASLLIFVLSFIPLSILVIMRAKKRTQVLVSYCALLVAGIIGVALVLKFVVPDFWEVWSRGLDGRGREELYFEAIEAFKQNYLFGVGFLYKPQSANVEQPVMQFFHNTYLQFLAAGGVCGLIAVFMHKLAQYRPFFYRKLFKDDNFIAFAFIIMLGANLFGLMDITIWSQNYFIPILPLMAIMDDEQAKRNEPAKATKNKRLRGVGEVTIKTVAIIMAGCSFGLMMLISRLLNTEYIITLMDSISAIAVMVLLYILREAFRTIGYLALLGVPRSSLRFGRSRKSKFLYSHNTAPMYSRDMFLVELYPMLMTAVAPGVGATLTGNVYMMLAVAIMFACSASDVCLAYSLGKRSGDVVQDHPTMPAYYVNYPDVEVNVESVNATNAEVGTEGN